MKRWVSLLSILSVLLVSSLTMAQDSGDVAGDIEIFSSARTISYVLSQESTGGTLEVLEDGSYALSLAGVEEQLSVVQVNPPSILSYNLSQFTSSWEAALAAMPADAEDNFLEAAAELNLGGDLIILTIKGAAYDSNAKIITYTVDLVQYIPSPTDQSFNLDILLSASDKVDVPSEFGASSLTISTSNAFWASLQSGAQARRASLREAENPDCQVARDLLATLDADSNEYRVTRAWLNVHCE